MKIAISLENDDGINSRVSDIFGRCRYFMFIDPQNMSFEIEKNPARNASGGAGIQAAQFIADNKPDAVISGHIGPRAQTVIASADIPVFQFSQGSVEDALGLYEQKKLNNLTEADVPDHSGLK